MHVCPVTFLTQRSVHWLAAHFDGHPFADVIDMVVGGGNMGGIGFVHGWIGGTSTQFMI